ncbi:MAG: lysylphosphatidylglycerol synthase transmembrane domain-containing protein, partial [Saprospiraceae bacterium]
MLKSKFISVLKYIVILAVSFGLLALAFKGIKVTDILNEMLQANISWLTVAVFIGLVGFVSRAFRWKLLIESLGHTPSLKNTTYALMVGYFANLALPRLGEVTRCGSLSKAETIPFSSLLGTVIVERVIDVISLLLCMLLAFILEFDRIGKFLDDNIIHPVANKFYSLMFSPVLISITLVVIAGLIWLVFYLIKKPGKNNEESKFVKLIKGLIDGLKSIGKLKRPGMFIFFSAFIWFLAFLGMYISFLALPATNHLDLSAALFLLVVSGLGMAAPVQGGIGA